MIRRAIQSGIVSTVVASFVVLSPAPAHASSNLTCATSSTYGAQCEQILSGSGGGMHVGDITMTYSPQNASALTNLYWRFLITGYTTCNPVGQSKSACKPTTGLSFAQTIGYYHGNPPIVGTSCSTVGGNGFAYQECTNYGMQSVQAKNGQFPGWINDGGSGRRYTVNPTYVCVEVQTSPTKATWTDMGGTNGLRACNKVYA